MASDEINLWMHFVSINESNMWYYLYVIPSSDAPNGTWIGNLLGHQQNEITYAKKIEPNKLSLHGLYRYEHERKAISL